MPNPYPAEFATGDGDFIRIDGEVTFTDPANQPGGGGGGQVNSVTAGDSSITVAGTVTDPTVAVASGGVTAGKIGALAVGSAAIAASAVTTAKISSGAASSGQLLTADGAGGVSFANNAAVASVTAADTSVVVGGTATAPTVRTGTLDVIAADHPPAADWSNNSHKITGLANGTVASDAAAFGQIPTALPPNGSAGGNLSGSYPNPTVAAIQGVAVSGTAPSANQVLTASDATHAAWATPSGGGGAGSSSLVYRYTVSGSAKASIDTGVDTPNAGSNDWTNGDLLEVYLYSRADESVPGPQINLVLNNDTGSVYDMIRLQDSNTTVTGATSLAQAHWFFNASGATATTSVFGSMRLNLPNYAGTTGFKDGEMTAMCPDETAANMLCQVWGLNYRSTSAITRLAVLPNTGGAKFVVGTQLLIYKRTAS